MMMMMMMLIAKKTLQTRPYVVKKPSVNVHFLFFSMERTNASLIRTNMHFYTNFNTRVK